MLDPSIDRTVSRARAYLATARWAADNGDPDSGASRAYYVLYHVTIRLLEVIRQRRRERWDHVQLYNAFLDNFCRPGFRFNSRDGDNWFYVMEVRLLADYDRSRRINASAAIRAIDRAETLVEKMFTEMNRNV